MEENIQSFLQTNPKIVNLLFHPQNTQETIQISTKFLKFLGKTKLRTLHLTHANFKTVRSIEHISLEELEGFYTHEVQHPNDISITFDNLNRLRLTNCSNIPKWKELIVQNKKLTTLLYINDADPNTNVDNFIQFVEALPELNTFKFVSSSLSPADLVRFLKACAPIQNLKTIDQFMPQNNLQTFCSDVEKIMDNQPRSSFKGPTKSEAKYRKIGDPDAYFVNFARTTK